MKGRTPTFDYAEAQRLRDEGHKVLWIAYQLGVSVWSIYRATDGGRRAEREREWYRASCHHLSGPEA